MKRLTIGIILLIGFLLRIVAIGSVPAGFTPDEASFGYDAYSIIKTGRDQWGKAFPLVLESFGDYKSPLYTYLTIPSVFVFGLNKFSVRLPNAIMGTLAIYATYLLANQVMNAKKRFLVFSSMSFSLSEIAGFILAISPWHIMMSRGAFEANLTTFFLTISLFFFPKSAE